MSGSYSTYHSGAGREEDFPRLFEQINSNLMKINQNVASYGQMIKQLSTTENTESFRNKLHNIQHYTQQLIKDTSDLIKKIHNIPMPLNPTEQRQRKAQRERLTNEFGKALNTFQAIQREEVSQAKQSIRRARAASNLSFDENQRQQQLIQLESPVQNQNMMQMEEEIDMEMLRERETAMHELEADIVAVNEVFRDLATMVHEQGEVVDSIEAQIENTQIHVGEATNQLSQAKDYQSKVRKKKFCLLVVLLIVLAVVIGIIVYETSGN